jgi:uncharacterized protein (UPF0276 family)
MDLAIKRSWRDRQTLHELREIRFDEETMQRVAAEVAAVKAIIAELPAVLTGLSERISALERAVGAASDLSASVLQLSTDLQNISERLRFVETGWLPYEETMRSHHAKRSA